MARCQNQNSYIPLNSRMQPGSDWGAPDVKIRTPISPRTQRMEPGTDGAPDSQNTNSSIGLNSENRAWMGRP